MKKSSLAIAALFAFVTAPILEAQVVLPHVTSNLSFSPDAGAQIFKIDSKNGKASDKKKPKKHAKPKAHAAKEKPKGGKAKAKRTHEQRASESSKILGLKAPQGRDMIVRLGAAPLALLGPNVVFADLPEDRFVTYRNCPPGLAKKDPPCVPPGLAKKGVTYDEWVTYDDARLDGIYRDERQGYLDDAGEYDDDDLLLNSDQIATLYGLRPAQAGRRYALIDGQPVLLAEDDNRSLLALHRLARSQNLPDGTFVAPTAALTQDELRQAYELPELQPGYNYAVVNGELVTLADSAYETLQLIRIARSVF